MGFSYLGSKRRIAKEILPIILKDRKEGQYYVEPFVGGGNTLTLVDGNRIAADAHPFLMCLWIALQQGWLPKKKIDQDEYEFFKELSKKGLTYDLHLDAQIGYAGFKGSFGSHWFASWARNVPQDVKMSDQTKYKYRTRYEEGFDKLSKIAKNVKDVDFYHSDYSDLKIPNNSIIYCDIPYKDTTSYDSKNVLKPFVHDEFWPWAKDKSESGHKVFVSEYQAPEEWKTVWSKDQITSVHNEAKHYKTKTEKLFTLGE